MQKVDFGYSEITSKENDGKSSNHTIQEETDMTIGEKIREARKSAGLTQEQMADKLMVSRQAITKWESDRGIPDVSNLLDRYANLFFLYVLIIRQHDMNISQNLV